MSRVAEAIESLGSLFHIGFEGTSLSDDTAAFLSQAGIGGITYFAYNYSSPEQIAELSNQVQECRKDYPLWICIDQEGGRVQRFKEPFLRLPSAAKVASTQSPKLVFELSEAAAKELKAVGVNVNYAPCADILTNVQNEVIGDRSYGNEEADVSKYVSAVIRGHLVAGVQPCLKHFPGHGSTNEDSHFALPKIDTSLDVLQSREFRPFVKGFKSRCSMVMSAHIVNPALDPNFPATLSRQTLREVLRKDLRYSRLIVSDDMEMKAITDHYGVDDAPRLAVEAGCDVLNYRTEKAARRAYEALLKALEKGTLDPNLVLESAQRTKDLKKEALADFHKVDPREVKSIVGCEDHKKILDEILKLVS